MDGIAVVRNVGVLILFVCGLDSNLSSLHEPPTGVMPNTVIYVKFVRQQRFVRQNFYVLQNVQHEHDLQITEVTNPASWISVSTNFNSLDTS